MDTIGYRIRCARERIDMTQEQLGRLCGTTKQTIFKYENDIVTNIPMDRIESMASALNVSPVYLMGWSDNIFSAAPNIAPIPHMNKVPLIGSIACGTPIMAEEHIEDYVDIPAHISADFALTCKGDSMINARIFDGDIVYIRHQETVDNGQIAAVLIDGEATLKRVRLFDDHISLEPENPQYRPLVYWGEEMNTVRILGKAVAFTSAIR